MTNRIIPSIVREIGDRRAGDCASFIEANLADVVAPFDNDDEDAAFAGEITRDLDEGPMVIVVAGVETGRCEIRRTEVVAVAHLVAVLLVIMIVVVLVLAIAVILVIAIAVGLVIVLVFAIMVVLMIAIAVVFVIANVAVLSLPLVVVLVPVVVAPLVIDLDVLVLAIPLAVLPVIVVVIVMVVLVLTTVTVVRVFAVVIVVVVARVFVTTTVVVVTARPSRELAIAIAVARSRSIVPAILAFGDTGEDGFGTSHEGYVKAFTLPDVGIRERHLGFFSWDEARREVESGVGVIAFGKEVLIFGGAGIEFDEFREESPLGSGSKVSGFKWLVRRWMVGREKRWMYFECRVRWIFLANGQIDP